MNKETFFLKIIKSTINFLIFRFNEIRDGQIQISELLLNTQSIWMLIYTTLLGRQRQSFDLINV